MLIYGVEAEIRQCVPDGPPSRASRMTDGVVGVDGQNAACLTQGVGTEHT